MPYAVYTVKLWAEIDGKTVEVQAFSARFGLNGIPRATLVLPVGRETKSLKASPAHTTLGKLSDQAKAIVWCEIQRTSGDSSSLPGNKPFKLFEGYVFAPGYARDGGGANFSLSLIHWLADLTEGSAISPQSHPLNPADITFAAASLVGPLVEGGGQGAVFLPRTKAQSSITAETVRDDLWGKGIKPWLLEVAQLDLINRNEVQPVGVQPVVGGNKAAIAALNRIEGAQYKDGVPLGLDIAIASEQLLAEAIADNIGQRTLDSMAQATLWDVLINSLAPDFMFSLVPLVNKALVVPFIPGLRTPMKGTGGTNATISARDQAGIKLNKFLPRPLRAVGLFSGYAFAQGGALTDNPEAGKSIGGWFQGRETGLVMLRNGPRWATAAISPTGWVVDTAPAGKPVADAANPNAGQPPDNNPGQVKGQIKPLLDRYAQAVYVQEVLQGRSGTITTPLRFDICPGATINVEGASETFINKDALGENFHADVVSVDISVFAGGNGSPGSGGVVFEVAHMRSKEENGKDATSITRHPLYKQSFSGCSLIAAQ